MEAAEHGTALLRLCDRLHPGLSAERGAILLSMAAMLQQVLSQERTVELAPSEKCELAIDFSSGIHSGLTIAMSAMN